MITVAQLQDRNFRVAPNFTALEVVARTEPGERQDARWADRSRLTPEQAGNLGRVAQVAQWVRGLVGRSVRVTSGYRAGDTKQHGDGSALDIQVEGMSPLQLAHLIRARAAEAPVALRQVIAEARGTGLDGLMGEGSNRWVHLAVVSARWGATSSAWLETSDGRTYSALRRAAA